MSEPLFYEDVPVGLAFDTDGLVITDTHVVQFAGLSGDFFPLHLDDEFARSLGFEGRVAHGLLGLILVDGLKNRASQRFQAVASLSWQWNFRKPMYPGDRIQGHLRVADKRLTKRGDRGILTLAVEVRNAKGDVLQEGTNLLMVRTRAVRQLC
ncbi:MAG TPA: MaoC family dehydratase [Candidatus Acidoferrales bacterium]|nr:MaoC family dehydratase [Bryobacteraceae bacterium]HTS67123.1 MaoC family dehydratase [Candidatus Acidoferrales bacterium]